MSKNNDKVMSNAEKEHKKERNYLHVITRTYVLFILAIYPLYVGVQGYDDIVHSKAVLFWAGAGIFLVVFLLFYLAYRLGFGGINQPPKLWKTLTAPDWALLAFMLFITLSCLLSPYKKIAFWGATNRNDGWLTYFLMTASYFPISRWYKPKLNDFVIFAISSSIVCIIGFLQFYGFDFMNLFPYNRPPFADESGKPFYSGFSMLYRTTIGNIDFVSAYVCMTVIIFGILFVKSHGYKSILFLAASAMNFILMIIGGADAGKVGILGAMVLLVPFWVSERRTFGRFLTVVGLWGVCYSVHHFIMINFVMSKWGAERPFFDLRFKESYSTVSLKAIIIISFIIILSGIIVPNLKFKPLLNTKTIRVFSVSLLCILILSGLAGINLIGKELPKTNIIHQAREMMHGNLEDDFGSRRGFIWKRAINQVPQHALFGTGSDTFIKAFGEDNQKEAKALHSVFYDKAHNDFIQILLCNGIFALISYICFAISLVILSIKAAFKSTFAIVTLGAAVGYLLQSFFGIDTVIVTPIFWAILGILRSHSSSIITDDCKLI